MNNIYVVSKPLQWLNAINIKSKYSSNNDTLIVIDHFRNCKEFIQAISLSGVWSNIFYAQSRVESIRIIRRIRGRRRLILDTDYGIYGFLYALVSAEVFLYEEGVGTYFASFFNDNFQGKMRQVIYKLFKIGCYLGDGLKTKKVFVYYPHIYSFFRPTSKVTIECFPNSFNKMISDHYKLLFDTFNPGNQVFDLKGKHIAIYLTGHSINKKVLKKLLEKEAWDFILIKLHPHLARNFQVTELSTTLYESKNVLVDYSGLMIEILIQYLQKQNRLTVIHESSSGVINFYNSKEKVELIDISSSKSEYSENYKKMVNLLNG